ncbi:uncharacterized protein LOC129582888 [Paramacrobiotus metropolitanus]|uniref:uncharacterized protein LOC129582888 n=1 Tax=Paramacrobiotus metropolitanus TaxID=2943436 RepID=UPI00244602EC|nr:uncharacterized protein LOC129582888 [Paramacrobiotus metropolitanus]
MHSNIMAAEARYNTNQGVSFSHALHNMNTVSRDRPDGGADRYRTRINMPRMLAINWGRLALALCIFALESAITSVFHINASDNLRQQFPLTKTVMGFLYGLLVLIFWNRVRKITSGTIEAAEKFHQGQNDPATKLTAFPGFKLPPFRRTIAIVATSISFLGSFAFTVITSLLFVDVMQILREEGDATIGYTLVVLYSLLLFCAVVAMLTGIHGSLSLLLLLKALPPKFYPLEIFFGENRKPVSVQLFKDD